MLYGHGFGLRVAHYNDLLERNIDADFVEAISENFMARGGRPRAVLAKLRRDLPVVLHGVSLSIGSVDPLSVEYLNELAALCDEVAPALVSDHLCFGSYGSHYGHDLWPIPYTEESLKHLVVRVSEVQKRLGRRLALENVSSYVEYNASTLREWEFLAQLTQQADCSILLDINNVYVSAHNHGFSAYEYLDALPVNCIAQMHLAGHKQMGTYLLDDHGSSVPDCVWELYRYAVRRFGKVPTIIEWDENVPTLERLETECRRARENEHQVLAENGHAACRA